MNDPPAAGDPALRLRPVTAADVDVVLAFELANRAHFERSVPARPPGFFDRGWQARNLRELSADRSGRYCLVLSPDGALVGRINLSFVEREDGLWADVGYRVGARHSGKGIATAAVREALGWLVSQGRFRGAEARAMVANRASVRTLEKTGFVAVPDADRPVPLGGRTVVLRLFRRAIDPEGGGARTGDGGSGARPPRPDRAGRRATRS